MPLSTSEHMVACRMAGKHRVAMTCSPEGVLLVSINVCSDLKEKGEYSDHQDDAVIL